MSETELKFQVPKPRRDAVARAMATATARRVVLRAQYFDTEDRRLARARLALRVRREGRRWVQTLKGAGDGLWQRLEHEVALPAAAATVPPADLSLHDGTAAGEALRRALGDGELRPIYTTQVRRTLRLVRAPGCQVEVAFDEGALLAAGRRWPLCELEFELKSGDAAAMSALAARWVARFGLTLDVRSKSERGDRLARGVALDEPVKAQPLVLPEGVDSETALRAIVASCLTQILANASDIAHGDSSPEHVHQLRVGLRRLRTALRELGDESAPQQARWSQQLSVLFGDLGATRDRDALAATLLPALHQAGVPGLELPDADTAADPRSALCETSITTLWLQLLAFAAADAPGGAAFVERAANRLQRLHRQVRRDAARFAALDDPARHRLRKRVKRLRYLCEFAASQFGTARLRRYLRKLMPVQEALGAYNDVCVARNAFSTIASDEAQAMFALGWLARERELRTESCIAALQKLRKVRTFW